MFLNREQRPSRKQLFGWCSPLIGAAPWSWKEGTFKPPTIVKRERDAAGNDGLATYPLLIPIVPFLWNFRVVQTYRRGVRKTRVEYKRQGLLDMALSQ